MPLQKASIASLRKYLGSFEEVLVCHYCGRSLLESGSVVTADCVHLLCSEDCGLRQHREEGGQCVECAMAYFPKDLSEDCRMQSLLQSVQRIASGVRRHEAVWNGDDSELSAASDSRHNGGASNSRRKSGSKRVLSQMRDEKCDDSEGETVTITHMCLSGKVKSETRRIGAVLKARFGVEASSRWSAEYTQVHVCFGTNTPPLKPKVLASICAGVPLVTGQFVDHCLELQSTAERLTVDKSMFAKCTMNYRRIAQRNLFAKFNVLLTDAAPNGLETMLRIGGAHISEEADDGEEDDSGRASDGRCDASGRQRIVLVSNQLKRRKAEKIKRKSGGRRVVDLNWALQTVYPMRAAESCDWTQRAAIRKPLPLEDFDILHSRQ